MAWTMADGLRPQTLATRAGDHLGPTRGSLVLELYTAQPPDPLGLQTGSSQLELFALCSRKVNSGP